ncbi:MAG: helix-turn-helix transcriptional regulator [Candidatus Thorarchaeota archaeon]|nr:MAG: helix-turn-helix transcriptional regulator [Candidatus Thorarchaeota archaeon]
MSRNSELDLLKNEIEELRETVTVLKQTVEDLTSRLHPAQPVAGQTRARGQYDIFSEGESGIERDVSWNRLVNLLQESEEGLTATELAGLWGKSRSRTSEVLNKLVEEGYLVKFRDGREIKFAASEDEI